MHKEKFDDLEGKVREDKFNLLKSDLQRKQNEFTVANKSNEAAVYSSFSLSQIIAWRSKQLADGQFVKECVLMAIEIICPEKQ
jgi:hypothetical protein